MTKKQQPYGIYHLHDPINNRTLKFHKPLEIYAGLTRTYDCWFSIRSPGRGATFGHGETKEEAMHACVIDHFKKWDKGSKALREVAVMIEETPPQVAEDDDSGRCGGCGSCAEDVDCIQSCELCASVGGEK